MALIVNDAGVEWWMLGQMVYAGGKWWVLELSGGHYSQVMGIGAKWSPVVISGSVKHNNLHYQIWL